MKIRARVYRERIDVTTLDERACGEESYVFGRWRLSMLIDGQYVSSDSFPDWQTAMIAAVREVRITRKVWT